MAELHWFPLYARDWLSGEGTSMMLPEQEGAFIRLLLLAWGDGSTEPSLPDDDQALAQMGRLGPRWKRLGGLVRAQFTPRDGRLYNAKLSEVWAEQQRQHDVAVARASAGGKARAAKLHGLLGAPGVLGAQPKQDAGGAPDVLECAESKAEAAAEAELEVFATDDLPRSLNAVNLAIWANMAIGDRWGEQMNPLHHGGAYELLQALTDLEVEPDVARLSIYRQCRASKKSKAPSGLNYFLGGITDDWNVELARRSLASSGESPPPQPSAPPPRIAGADVFAQIRALVKSSPDPRQGVTRFIPLTEVEALGPQALHAYKTIGGASRVLAAIQDPKSLGFLVREFTDAYSSASNQRASA